MSALPFSDTPWPDAALRSFRLSAAAEPGLLPRVLEPFAKRGLTPERLRVERRGDLVMVEILAALPADTALLIAASLAGIVGVTLLAAD